MIKITDISLPITSHKDEIIKSAAKRLKISSRDIRSIKIIKKSVDARKKNDIRFVYNICADVGGGEERLMSHISDRGISLYKKNSYKVPRPSKIPEHPPVVAGFGPGGMFAALLLAQAGLSPVVIERGEPIEKRSAAVELFRRGGVFSETSNIQFGEGGAGTFSDGKLNTGVNDIRIEKVFREFVRAGAPEDILYESKPHIGTDLLPSIVKNIRKEIIALGGEIRFCEKLSGLIKKDGELCAIEITRTSGEKYTMPCDNLILAIGHSSRDTLRMLFEEGADMEQKSFSVGARIEHPQSLINESQYGAMAKNPAYSAALGAADYKLSAHLENGRGVYTFCMCPGGEVVFASSEKEQIVTNGMSENGRSKENANSALLVGVGPSDFESSHPLSGIDFQQKIESAAFEAVGRAYTAPVQRVGDFLKSEKSRRLGVVAPSIKPGYALSSMDEFLPTFVTDSMRQGINLLQRKLSGFSFPDAVLTGPETRSSSPVRILRGEDMQSLSIKGLYPCAEGAGYAGGITSSAVDGIKCAEKIIDKIG